MPSTDFQSPKAFTRWLEAEDLEAACIEQHIQADQAKEIALLFRRSITTEDQASVVNKLLYVES